jgi:hypothetical protein
MALHCAAQRFIAPLSYSRLTTNATASSVALEPKSCRTTSVNASRLIAAQSFTGLLLNRMVPSFLSVGLFLFREAAG